MTFEDLSQAVKLGNIERINNLIDNGAPLFNTDQNIWSDNHLIFKTPTTDIIEVLLQHNYPLNVRNTNGSTIYTVLMSYCVYYPSRADISSIKLLFDYGQKIDDIITGFKENSLQTPLHHVVRYIRSYKYKTSSSNRMFEIMDFLLKNGHPVNCMDHKKRTPLHYLFYKWKKLHYRNSRNSAYHAMIILLQNGADPLIKDDYGYKASQYIRAIPSEYSKFQVLFDVEKKHVTLFQKLLPIINDLIDIPKRKRKYQRIE